MKTFIMLLKVKGPANLREKIETPGVFGVTRTILVVAIPIFPQKKETKLSSSVVIRFFDGAK